MRRIALDLEMNDDPNITIIQVGACSFDVESGTIIDTFNAYINSDTKVSDYITKLTNITQLDIINGISLEEAYWRLLSFRVSTDSMKLPLVTWGAGDMPLLRKQLNNPEDWKLGRTEMNAKNLFQAWRESHGRSTQGGLAKALTCFGLNFIGTKHNAMVDAVNTAIIYSRLVKEFKREV